MKSSRILARELYDHASDPGEYRNLAELREFTGVCKELSMLLKTGQNELE